MDKILNQSLLYDFYGELLNENQKKIYEMYIFENLSLAEIAESEGISRQGVYETFKRASSILNNYEQKLHMLEQYRMLEEKLKGIKSALDEYKVCKADDKLTLIQSEIDHILERL